MRRRAVLSLSSWEIFSESHSATILLVMFCCLRSTGLRCPRSVGEILRGRPGGFLFWTVPCSFQRLRTAVTVGCEMQRVRAISLLLMGPWRFWTANSLTFNFVCSETRMRIGLPAVDGRPPHFFQRLQALGRHGEFLVFVEGASSLRMCMASLYHGSCFLKACLLCLVTRDLPCLSKRTLRSDPQKYFCPGLWCSFCVQGLRSIFVIA